MVNKWKAASRPVWKFCSRTIIRQNVGDCGKGIFQAKQVPMGGRWSQVYFVKCFFCNKARCDVYHQM